MGRIMISSGKYYDQYHTIWSITGHVSSCTLLFSIFRFLEYEIYHLF